MIDWVQDIGTISSNPDNDYKAFFRDCEQHSVHYSHEFYVRIRVNPFNSHSISNEYTRKVEWYINDLRGAPLPHGPVAKGYAWTVEKAKGMAAGMLRELRQLPTQQEDLDLLDSQQPPPPVTSKRRRRANYPGGWKASGERAWQP